MNIKTATKLAAAIACAGSMASSQATSVTLATGGNINASTDPYVLGEVVPGVTGGSQVGRDVSIVNAIIPLSLGGTASVSLGNNGPQTANRSMNDFGPLPAPTDVGSVVAAAGDLVVGGGNVTITLTGSFTYLVAQWDGGQGGAEAYDIAALGAGDVITIAQNAYGHNMTGFSLLNPGETRVPDGGATVALLGLGIAGLGALRRKIS